VPNFGLADFFLKNAKLKFGTPAMEINMKRHGTYFLLFIVQWAFWPGTARAQLSGAEFLKIGAGGRGLGMGSAYVALANDESSALWNPAGIAKVRSYRGYFTYVSMFDNLAAYNFAAAAVPLGGGLSLGLSWARLAVDDIPKYSALQGTRFDRILNPALRSTGKAEGYFNSADNALLVTIGKAMHFRFAFGGGLAPYVLPVRLSIGVNLKMIQRQLNQADASAQGLDAGAIVEFFGLNGKGRAVRILSFGVSVFDAATSQMTWSTGSGYVDPLPMRVVFGVGLSQRFLGAHSRISLSLDGDAYDTKSLRFGGEYVFNRVLALRGGYRPDGWTAGAGLRLGMIYLDYSFAAHDLGASHRVGGGVRF